MTEQDRIMKAREMRDAAVQRRDWTQAKLDEPELMLAARSTAYHNVVDGMQDQINLIDALFPELINGD